MNKLMGPAGMEMWSCFDVYGSKEYPTQNWNMLLNAICTGRLAHTSHEKSICFLSGLDLIWHCLPLSLCPFSGHPARHLAHLPSLWYPDIYMSSISVMSGGFWAQSTPLNTNLLTQDHLCVSLLLGSGGSHFNRRCAEAVEQHRSQGGNTHLGLVQSPFQDQAEPVTSPGVNLIGLCPLLHPITSAHSPLPLSNIL